MEYHQLGEKLTKEFLKDQFQDRYYFSFISITCQTSVKGLTLFFLPMINIETVGFTTKEIESDPKGIYNCLERNKLVQNLEKTVQMNLKSFSADTTLIYSDNIPVKPVCKKLGINWDRKLSSVPI